MIPQKLWLLRRYKKVFEAEIVVRVQKPDHWLIYLDREIPLSWWCRLIWHPFRKNTASHRVFTLYLQDGYPERHLFGLYQDTVQNWLLPGNKITVIYWQHTGEIERIFPYLPDDLFLPTKDNHYSEGPLSNIDVDTSDSS